MSEKDISPSSEPLPEDGKWQGIARAIMELDMKLLELERALGLNGVQMPGSPASGEESALPGKGQNNDG